MDTVDRGTIHVLGWMMQDSARFHHTTQNGIQFETYHLFISGSFHPVFLDHDWLQVTEILENKTSGRKVLFHQHHLRMPISPVMAKTNLVTLLSVASLVGVKWCLNIWFYEILLLSTELSILSSCLENVSISSMLYSPGFLLFVCICFSYLTCILSLTKEGNVDTYSGVEDSSKCYTKHLTETSQSQKNIIPLIWDT
jgi:hypothetical protein